MNPTEVRKLLIGYIPMAVAVVVLAVFVATVPTVSRRESNRAVAAEDLFADGGLYGSAAGDTGVEGVGQGGPASRTGSSVSRPGAGGDGSAGDGDAGSGDGAWRPTGVDCARQELITTPLCRPTPAFTGDNGGSTMRNVDREEIRIVVYEPGGNPQVDALLGNFGADSNSDFRAIDALEAYVAFFNKHFETYGRQVRVIHKRGPGDASTPEQQVADAKAVAEELKASLVMSAVGSTAFHDELARQGIPSVAGGLQFLNSFYTSRSPYIFSMVPDLDLTLDHVAEYWCKRLMDRPAIHADDPVLQTQERKLGLIYPGDNVDLTGGPALIEKIEACGGEVTHVVTYASDVSTAQQQATNAIAQLREAGVTTVTCTCDPIAPIFFTNAATNQAWFPEWLQNGVLLTDVPDFGRLYNQQQWANSFGVTVFGKPSPIRETDAWTAYFAVKPDGDKENVNGAYYGMLMYIYSAIEAAGPGLNPTTFARGLFQLPAVGGTAPHVATVSFGNNGPGPYSGIDNVTEIWWDSIRRGPDGQPGYPFYVEGGARRYLGEWPTTDPRVFTDDGSAQPERDPDA